MKELECHSRRRSRNCALPDGNLFSRLPTGSKRRRHHIWDLEQGNSANPSRELIERLATHFRISVSELLEEDPNASSEPSELVALYRDLKTLSKSDLKTIETIMRGLKEAKKE
ncbi:transcriptional regulator with XRE-family HTH domain [Bradyrhizobium sp. LM3.4]